MIGSEIKHDARGFIHTDDILDCLIVENPEISQTAKHVNIVKEGNKDNKGEVESIRKFKTDNIKAIGSGKYEAKGIDDPKQGGKTGNTVHSEMVESINETCISNTWEDHVSSNKADITNDDKDHEEKCKHQITGGLEKTDNDIDPAKIIMAEITLEQKNSDAKRNQIERKEVEVWETIVKVDNTVSSDVIEEGIDALSANWLDTDEESDKEIYWDCKEDENSEYESESEEEIFWDSLSHIEEVETLERVGKEATETIIDDSECKIDDKLFKEVWSNIHENKAAESILNLDKNIENSSYIEKDEISTEISEMKAKKTSLGGKSPRKLNTTEIKKRQVRKVDSGKGILANLILFSVILGKVAIGKEIGGMMVRNRIEKGNLPKPYPTEQSK